MVSFTFQLLQGNHHTQIFGGILFGRETSSNELRVSKLTKPRGWLLNTARAARSSAPFLLANGSGHRHRNSAIADFPNWLNPAEILARGYWLKTPFTIVHLGDFGGICQPPGVTSSLKSLSKGY